jgi:hypothetical protein
LRKEEGVVGGTRSGAGSGQASVVAETVETADEFPALSRATMPTA